MKIDFNFNNPDSIEDLYQTISDFPGECTLIIHIINNKAKLNKFQSSKIFLSNDSLCLKALREKIGNQNVWLS